MRTTAKDQLIKIYLLSLVFGVLITAHAFGESSGTNVTIHLTIQTNSVAWNTKRSYITFMCKATVVNQTRNSLSISNLFQDPAGLALTVADKRGLELARLHCGPFHNESITIAAGGKESFWPYYGFVLPVTNTTLTLQLDGKLVGSNVARSLTSNIVELKIL